MIGALTGAELAAALGAATAGMAGSSLHDEWVGGGYSDPYNVGFGTVRETETKPAISGESGGTIKEAPVADTPEESFQEYDGEKDPTTGGVKDGSSVKTWVKSIIVDNPEEDQQVLRAVAPVAIPATQAYVAISKALGVSMKVEEMNIETKRVMQEALTQQGNFVYDAAKDLIKAWWDGVNIFFPKASVDAVSDALASLNIGDTAPGEINISDVDKSALAYPTRDYHFYEYPTQIEYGNNSISLVLETDGVGLFWNGLDNKYPTFYTVSLSPCTARKTYSDGRIIDYTSSVGVTRNGVTYYYLDIPYTITNTTETFVASTRLNSTYLQWDGAYLILNGVGGAIEGNYPEGTAKSEAPSYTKDTIPKAGGIATGEDTTEPVVKIALPKDPHDTIKDEDDPVGPTDPGDVEELPPAPLPSPIPKTDPANPSVPLTDPSVIRSEYINELVEELANTLDPQPSQSSGIIPIPPMPGIIDPETGGSSYPSIVPASGSGFIHVYNPTPQELASFGAWLWVSYADATIDKIWNNPFDGVIGAHELYATPQTDGRENIRSGFLTCPTAADLVRQRYTEIDCGAVIVPEYYGNYLDYSPYSQAYIYLPFIGINEVSIDDIVGHVVNIRYRIDAYTGSCIAMIFVAKNGYQNLCYQFAGNCSVEVPMAGGSQAAIKAGMMQAEAYARAAMVSAAGHLFSGIGSTLMGNISGAISSLTGIASDYANAKAGMEAARVANKSSVQHSGQFGSSHGAMSEKTPFIIIRNPIQVKVVNYNDDYGFPAHKRVIIGGCTGYLRVREVNVISAHATDDEKAAIEALLKNGVYVS